MSRLILVSNRLPVAVERTAEGMPVAKPATGGLATGLRGVREQHNALWVGWPGAILSPEELEALQPQFDRHNLAPVHLDAADIEGYYHGVANGVIWPLFHYQVDRIPLTGGDWAAYQRVNQRFAETVAAIYRPGDTIWVHAYHLFLVPQILRTLLPQARIGFFLHIPFPSSEVFGLLPWRKEVLAGLLGADLIGFHTASYLRHFSASLRRTLGLGVRVDRVPLGERDVRLGIFPLGVDAEAITAAVQSPGVLAEAASHRQRPAEERWLLSVDRLDYTKGIPRRLLAVDNLLERYPEWRGKVRFVQVTAPSREKVESYAQFQREIDELVGHINARWSTPSWSPIQHLHREVSFDHLMSLYLVADVMVVTPIRDGMNLVAKEFVAARADADGVLVLSEFAGAAAELPDALIVNPYDIAETADAMNRALCMPQEEQRHRMQRLATNVLSHTADRWAKHFLRELAGEANLPATVPQASLVPPLVDGANHLALFLDYDGTLVPFAATPGEALPDQELFTLLAALAGFGAEIHIVSGRPRAFLQQHFGNLPVSLHAEHCLWSRPAGSSTWSRAGFAEDSWFESVRKFLTAFGEATPGSIVEEKEASFSWHFRRVTQEYVDGSDFGEWQARELRLLLNEVLGNERAQVLAGNRVVEVRPSAVNKGLVARFVPTFPSSVVAIGDDTTDEDLFGAMPEHAVTVKIGRGASRARYRLGAVADVRSYLRELASGLGASRLGSSETESTL